MAVSLGKGCVLVLTEAEYLRGVRRGKFFRRRATLARRLAPNAADPIPEHGPRPER